MCHIARRRSARIEWSCILNMPHAWAGTVGGSDTYRSCGPILTIRTVRAQATVDCIDAFFRSGRREDKVLSKRGGDTDRQYEFRAEGRW